MKEGGHLCPCDVGKCPFWIKLKPSPSARQHVWVMTGLLLPGEQRDKPGNCTASGLAPWAVQVKLEWHHHSLCSTNDTTDGQYKCRPKTLLLSSHPFLCVAWCLISVSKHIQIPHSRWMRLMRTQVHQPCAHKKLKLVLPTSRGYGLNNSFNHTAVQFYCDTDVIDVNNLLKGLHDTGALHSL